MFYGNDVWYLDLYFPQVGKGGGESISLAFYSRAKRESLYTLLPGENTFSSHTYVAYPPTHK